MITLYVCLLLLAVHVALPGSDPRRMARVRLHHTWLVWSALAAQVLIISVLPDAGRLSNAAHLSTYVLAAAFVILNMRSAGTAMIGVGGGLNLAAIAINGGVMPASADALTASGWESPTEQFANSAVVPNARLPFLGDIFATPSWLPVNSVFSLGDIVVALGIALFLHQTCRPRSAPRKLPHARPDLTTAQEPATPPGPAS